MSPSARKYALAFALKYLLPTASAGVAWMPEEFDPLEDRKLLARADTATCGGISGLNPCGGDFPSDFCCPQSTTCLQLNSTSSVSATICCPAGKDCTVINPISCAQNAQNATAAPENQYHSDPTQQLQSCGSGCCPSGYRCENNQCSLQSNATDADPTPTTSSSVTSSATLPTLSMTMTETAAAPTADRSPPPSNPSTASSGTTFNGKSFAAGFVPGIALGAFLAALLLLLLFRKKHISSDSYVEEEDDRRDTLTDLGTLPFRRPTMHGRSISEPAIDPSATHRTDFLRSTPPGAGEPAGTNTNGYSVDVRSPASRPVTPSNRTPKIKALFSRSPFMNATPSTPPTHPNPMPPHLKRGTLSFRISPVRALKKQKSMHSLRRQMTDGSRLSENSNSSNRRLRPDISRSGSTETIQVLMPSNEPYTPDRAPQMVEVPAATYQQPKSASTWTTMDTSSDDTTPDERQQPQNQVSYPSSSRYPSEQQTYTTPTRPPIPRGVTAEAALGSPYTPTHHVANGKGKSGAAGSLLPPEMNVADTRRDTTFSAMMERAGLKRSDLIMGSGDGR